MRLAHQDPAEIASYKRAGWWGESTVGDAVQRWAVETPDAPAIVADGLRASWAEYDRRATELAYVLVGTGLPRGARVAVLLPDGIAVHVAFVAAERAGLTIVGLGHRAGGRELRHILGTTGAEAIVTLATHRDASADALVAELRADGLPIAHHVVVGEGGDPLATWGAAHSPRVSTSVPGRTAPTTSSS